jgi:hypothetical protein
MRFKGATSHPSVFEPLADDGVPRISANADTREFSPTWRAVCKVKFVVAERIRSAVQTLVGRHRIIIGSRRCRGSL